METEYAPHCSWRIRYHLVICIKYRKKLLTSNKMIDFFLYLLKEIAKRYHLESEKVGTDGDHVHLFVEAVPRYSPSRIMQIIKSITARAIFQAFPEVKKELWGGEFWSDGGYIGTVGDQSSTEVIKQYIECQGTKEEKENYHQLKLFNL